MSATNKKCCLIFTAKFKICSSKWECKQITLKPEFPIYPDYLLGSRLLRARMKNAVTNISTNIYIFQTPNNIDIEIYLKSDQASDWRKSWPWSPQPILVLPSAFHPCLPLHPFHPSRVASRGVKPFFVCLLNIDVYWRRDVLTEFQEGHIRSNIYSSRNRKGWER